MLKLAGFDALFAAAGSLYFLLALGGICFALWMGKTWTRKLVYAAIVLALFISPIAREMYGAIEYRGKLAAAQSLFEERCKTAGEKIYKTVDDVEGVLLMNVRSEDKALNRANPNWSDAGLPDESGGDDYIRTFLFWEQRAPASSYGYRGYVNNLSSNTAGHRTFSGYAFVDVKEADGSVYRYRLSGPRSTELLRQTTDEPPARYAVSFANLNDPAGRQLWVAGTTVTVTDTATQEMLASSTWYALEPGQGSRAGGRQPWGFATICPRSGNGNSPTRFFVDQVLKPKQRG